LNGHVILALEHLAKFILDFSFCWTVDFLGTEEIISFSREENECEVGAPYDVCSTKSFPIIGIL
jgi:hypothetical protein